MIVDRAFEEDGSFRYPSIDPSMTITPGVDQEHMERVLGDGLVVVGAADASPLRPQGGAMAVLTTYGLADDGFTELEAHWARWWRERFPATDSKPGELTDAERETQPVQ